MQQCHSRFTRRTFFALWAVVAAALAFVPTRATAAADSTNFTSRATAAVLMDADTGAVFFQHNADELLPPASMSKLMTLAVLFKAHQGRHGQARGPNSS